jgi:alpha-beta hydrolase superfamily lysophospholipase
LDRKEFKFEIANERLRGQYYDPGKTIAVVILVHGMGEYSRRYERTVVPFLLNNDFSVISYDQFGHGLSGFERGDHPGFAYLLDSIDQMISKAVGLFPGIPIFLYGHSMGGNLVISYSLRRKHKLTGVIATSPFLRLAFDPPAWKLSFGRLIRKIYPSLTMSNELDIKAISKDPVEIEAYMNDPLIHDRISSRYSLDFIRSGKWSIAHASSLQTPMLLIHGTGDRITSSKASKEFADNAGPIVTFIAVKGGYHELHHDIEKQEVLDSICLWIKKQITIT